MDTAKILKRYYLFVALPLMVITLMVEYAYQPGTMLNTYLKRLTVVGSGDLFLYERGGQRNHERGKQYFDKLVVPFYEKEDAAGMKFKDFMVWHVTEYEPAMLLQLGSEWPALTEWDIQTEKGKSNLKGAFGDDVLEVMEYWSQTYSHYSVNEELQYASIDDYFEAVGKTKFYTDRYKTRNGMHGGQSRYLILDQEIPETLQAHVSEPNITAQLLDLDRVSMNILDKGAVSVTQYSKQDQLTCAVSGDQTIYLVTAWERRVLHVGKPFISGETMPPRFSPIELTNEEFRDAKVHIITLSPGDCIYLPAYWWHQIEAPPEDLSVTVSFWYDVSSSWMQLIFEGIENNEL